ncbi:MAG: TetR/AcrR family transcriptional regulator, partial [Deltaproteobacteria bacterium]|nr:TetR/AcrR family transcriptional regulator [Deltaproteobacteria bacterium]
MPDSASEPALRSVDRAMERRRVTYENEVRRLIEAGFTLVQRTGKLEPTVGAIVAEAGLSNQAFYKHFHSKDELLLAMLEEGVLLLRSYIEHRVASGDTCRARIRNWIEGVLEQALSEQGAAATRPFVISRARLSERFPREVEEAEARLTAMLREEIRRGVASGELPAADPERDARLLYNLAMGWVERQLVDPSPADVADAKHLVEFAL